MRRLNLLAVAALLVLPIQRFATAADAVKDVLKEKGLTRVGNVYVLADETAVINEMKTLRVTKAEADKEVRARVAIDNQIAAKQKILKDSEKQYRELETRLPLIQKPDIKNNIIIRMNRLVADAKQAHLALTDLEEQAGKLSISGKAKFIDGLASLNRKATATTAAYATLRADAPVKAAVDRAIPKATLGPSPEFTAVAEELNKWQGGIESEAIPLRRHGGVYTADVLLNGEKFAMCVDTGASFIALPAEVAEKLKMIPTEQDQTIHLKLANGAVIEGKEMSLTSVRVGRFTVQNVRCVVLEKGLPDAPLLLGGSFLNHFIVKLDPTRAELQLTEVKQAGQASPVKPTNPAPTGSGATSK